MAKFPLGMTEDSEEMPMSSLNKYRKFKEQMEMLKGAPVSQQEEPEIIDDEVYVEGPEQDGPPQNEPPTDEAPPVPNMKMPAQEKPPLATTGMDLLSRLKAAQEARRRQLQNVALLEGAGGIGQAIARYYGSQPTDQSSIYKQMRAQAGLPMQELMEEKKAVDIENKEKGEKSAASLYRDIIKQTRPELEIPEDVPVEYLKTLVNTKGDSGLTPYQQFLIQKHQDLLQQRQIEEGRRQEQFQKGLRQKQVDTARGLLKDDPRYKKAVEQNMEFSAVGDLMKQAEAGNELAMAALGTKLARAMGEVGVLTDTDVVRYVSGTSWGRKLLDWYQKGATGTPSAQTLKEMMENVEVLKGKLKGDVDQVFTNATKRMKVAYPDLDKDIIKGMLGEITVDSKSEYSQAQERGIQKVMDKNKISREEAISALKDAGKL